MLTGQDRLAQDALDRLRSIGEAANAGYAGEEALRQGCLLVQQYGTNAFGPTLDKGSMTVGEGGTYFDNIRSELLGQGRAQLGYSLASGCSALAGDGSGTGFLSLENIKETGLSFALDKSEAVLRSLIGPYAKRLELETGYVDGRITWEALTVLPIWHDRPEDNHLFAQLSWNRSAQDGDTFNAGLALRRLNEARTVVYGVNAFLDHTGKNNHNRMSIGGDLQTSMLGLSANRYVPLSDWKSLDSYQEERAASGWDVELQERVPELPSWEASIKGFNWSSNEAGESEDVYGYDATIQWKPINIMEVRAGVRDEQSASPELHASLRLVYRFGEEIGRPFDAPLRLASVEERVYDKVRRENRVRTERRTKDSAYVRVSETIGANSASLVSGAVALSTGQQLPRPFTVTVSAAGGSIARLVFRDGAILTIGAGSTVQVEAKTITLVTGMFHFVSGATDVAINLPGGTVTLLGTDIDVSSNGANSVLRVRDGSARLDGSSSNSATLATGDAAESVGGNVGTLAPGDASFVAHTDNVSEAIDRTAAPLTGSKVAPYPVEAPRLLAIDPGNTVTIGLKFNTAVTASGGPVRLMLDVGGNARYAVLSGGSGTDDLSFTYTIQPGDDGVADITVEGIDLNGGSLTGDGKSAVTTIADSSVDLMGPISDVTAPAGYAVTFTTDPVDYTNHTAGAFQITGAEIGTTYDYSITSSGGGTAVTGNGSVAAVTQNVTGIDLSGLGDGTLTVSLTLTDAASNAGIAATDTVTKDAILAALDFAGGAYALAGMGYADVGDIPGWSFTRAAPALTYAEDAAGNLVSFAANEPRITDKGLLIEGSGTNLAKQSQELAGPAWNTATTTISLNSEIAPDGTNTADVVAASTSTLPLQSFSWVAGTKYTYSVYAKAVTDDTFGMRIQNAMGPVLQDQLVIVDLTSGTAIYNPNNQAPGATVAIELTSGGYYRIAMTFTATASQAGYFALQGATGVAFWGIQLEAADAASSYIPTGAAAVTRNADVAAIAQAVPQPNSLVVHYEPTSISASARSILQLDSGDNSNRQALYLTGAIPAARLIAAGSTEAQISVGAAVTAGQTIKHTARFAEDDVQAARNGVLGAADTSATLPGPSTHIRIGSNATGGDPAYGYIHDLRIYSTAKSDAELQALTNP